MRMTGFIGLAGRNWFDEFVSHANVIICNNEIEDNIDTGIYAEYSFVNLTGNLICGNYLGGSPGPGPTFTGIEVVECYFVNIAFNVLSRNHVNIYIESSNNVKIFNNEISDGWATVPERPEYPIGIDIIDTQVKIENNVFSGANTVIHIENSVKLCVVSNNTINNGPNQWSRYGISSFNSNLLVKNNTIFNCTQWAISTEETNQIIVDNFIEGCYDGIIISTTESLVNITNNSITNNLGIGIQLEYVDNFIIDDCNVSNNGIDGIDLLYTVGVINNTNLTRNGNYGLFLFYTTVNISNSYIALNLGEYDTYSYYSTLGNVTNNYFGNLVEIP